MVTERRTTPRRRASDAKDSMWYRIMRAIKLARYTREAEESMDHIMLDLDKFLCPNCGLYPRSISIQPQEGTASGPLIMSTCFRGHSYHVENGHQVMEDK